MVEYLISRRTGIALAIVGALVFALIFRGENTRTRITRVENDSPCNHLTTSECALKLFKALPDTTKRQLKINSSTLRSLQRKAKRERQSLRRSRENLPPKEPGAGGSPAGGSTTGNSPSIGSAPAGTQPSSSTASIPLNNNHPPTTPSAPTVTVTRPPLVQTPGITTPQVGPVPSVKVPPIMVPCIEIKQFITC